MSSPVQAQIFKTPLSRGSSPVATPSTKPQTGRRRLIVEWTSSPNRIPERMNWHQYSLKKKIKDDCHSSDLVGTTDALVFQFHLLQLYSNGPIAHFPSFHRTPRSTHHTTANLHRNRNRSRRRATNSPLAVCLATPSSWFITPLHIQKRLIQADDKRNGALEIHTTAPSRASSLYSRLTSISCGASVTVKPSPAPRATPPAAPPALEDPPPGRALAAEFPEFCGVTSSSSSSLRRA